MFFPYFSSNDLIVIFLKYNTDFCWKISAFRNSTWAQETKLRQPGIRTTQLAHPRSNLFFFSDPPQYVEWFSSSEPSKRKLRTSKLKMSRHRTHYTLFHFFLQLSSENNGRWMQGEASFTSREAILLITLLAQMQWWESRKYNFFLSRAERR